MFINIYSYRNYKAYMNDKLNILSESERGMKQKLAKLIGCQPSYLSQILNGNPNLTPEQVYKVNKAFGHDKHESKYFRLIVEMNSAETEEYKEFVAAQIEELSNLRFNLKKRLKDTTEISQQDMDQYYSSWYYTAIHTALDLAELQSPQAIAQRFHITVQMATNIIEFLMNSGLVEKVDDRYVWTKKKIHLDRNSSFIQRHHINWRSQSLQSVEKNDPGDMHYSSAFSISKRDFEILKEMHIKNIQEIRQVIAPSKAEEIYAFTLDLYRVS